MRICPQCNEDKNDNNERFCISCGMDLDGVSTSTVDQSVSSFNSELTTKADVKPEPVESTSTEEQEVQNNEPAQMLPDDIRGRRGRLVLLSDEKIMLAEMVERVQRLVGRADLLAYTQKDPDLISRSHFTVYGDGERYMICDGITSVQDRPSKHGIFINGKMLERQEPTELKAGDEISVSDITMKFEVV